MLMQNADVAKQTSKAKLAYLTLKQKIKRLLNQTVKFYIDKTVALE